MAGFGPPDWTKLVIDWAYYTQEVDNFAEVASSIEKKLTFPEM